MPIEVLLADGQALVREAIAALLKTQPNLSLVDVESDGAAALEAMLRLKPAVAVIDLRLTGTSGMEILRKSRLAGSRTAIVLLAPNADLSPVRQAVREGALGYVTKDADSNVLLEAVRSAAHQRLFLCPRVAHAALSEAPAQVVTPGPEALTEREREVLRLVVEGLSSKEIAVELRLSVRTVDGHRASVMDKLGIRTVPGLVKYALHHQLTAGFESLKAGGMMVGAKLPA
ncbi:MAG: response regulator transcription factor [Deltaproteobacteria bacterium]|nr:response regulator transcription factor [Deltaproteobacteria bacterium]